MKKQGFLVLEFMIYLLLFSFLAALLLYFVLHSSLFLRKRSNWLAQELSLYSCLDIIENIAQKAPVYKHAYKCLRPEQIVWHDQQLDLDIGFMKINNDFYYIKGVYNSAQQQWHRKRRALILKNIQEIAFEPLVCQGAYDHLDSLVVHIMVGNKKIKRVVRYLQRVVV